MLRNCIFAHFNKDNSLEANVIDYLKKIKVLIGEIFFILTSGIDKKNLLYKNIFSKI